MCRNNRNLGRYGTSTTHWQHIDDRQQLYSFQLGDKQSVQTGRRLEKQPEIGWGNSFKKPLENNIFLLQRCENPVWGIFFLLGVAVAIENILIHA